MCSSIYPKNGYFRKNIFQLSFKVLNVCLINFIWIYFKFELLEFVHSISSIKNA